MVRVTGIDHEDSATIYMKHGVSRGEMITAAAARALEDSIRALPAKKEKDGHVPAGTVIH